MGKLKFYKICLKKLCIQKHRGFMKLSLIIGILLSVSTYVKANAQQINIEAKNQSIERIFKEIERQTNYRFFFNNDCFDADQRISLSVKNVELKEVLEKILDERYKYEIQDRLIIISLNTLSQKNIEIHGTWASSSARRR